MPCVTSLAAFSLALSLVVAAPAASIALAPEPVQAAPWRTWLANETAPFSGVVLVGRDDAIEAEIATGLADSTSGRRNTMSTRFNLGSINKTFTATAIAQLVQQGRLGLDDPLIRHLTDVPNQDAARRITIRQMLTHRSGLAQFMRADFGDVSVAAMAKAVGDAPLEFEPGTRQMYSNGGYVVLGRLIEVVSGQRYEDYVMEHIYRPAGMTASGFVRAGGTDPIALPIISGDSGGAGGTTSPAPAPRPGNPAGGGYSTAADLFRFARALRAGRLLDQKMTAFVLDGTFAEDPKWGFALREQIVGGRRFIGNGGGAPGVNAEFRFEPSGPYTAIVLSNSSPPAATTLLASVLARIVASEVPARQLTHVR